VAHTIEIILKSSLNFFTASVMDGEKVLSHNPLEEIAANAKPTNDLGQES
jgi:hypothetical protein